MSKLSTRTAALVAAGALSLGAGVGLAGLASADPSTSPTPNPSASSTAGGTAPLGRHGPGGFGRLGGLDTQSLAEKLGVTEAKLTDALEGVRKELKSTARPFGGERPDPEQRLADLASRLADELDISQGTVTSALEELRAEHQAEHQKAFRARLDEAVEAGTLTRAEADAVVKAADKGVIPMGGRGPR